MNFARFVDMLLAAVPPPVRPDEITAETELESLMGFDSFAVLEIIVVTEAMAHLVTPISDLPVMGTMGDVYNYFLLVLGDALAE